MKTFTEAFNAIQTNKLLSKNLNSFAEEQLTNKKFVQFAQEIALLWAENIANSKPGMEIATTCSIVQSIFNTGILTGIEMEKSSERKSAI